MEDTDQDFLPNFVKSCDLDPWEIREKTPIGTGKAGVAYRACRGDDCDYVAKFIPQELYDPLPKFSKNLEKERLLLKQFGDLKLAPKLQGALFCPSRRKLPVAISKDFKDKSLDEAVGILFTRYVPDHPFTENDEKTLRRVYLKLISRALKHDVCLTDVHGHNIHFFVNKDGKWDAKFIDWGNEFVDPSLSDKQRAHCIKHLKAHWRPWVWVPKSRKWF